MVWTGAGRAVVGAAVGAGAGLQQTPVVPPTWHYKSRQNIKINLQQNCENGMSEKLYSARWGSGGSAWTGSADRSRHALLGSRALDVRSLSGRWDVAGGRRSLWGYNGLNWRWWWWWRSWSGSCRCDRWWQSEWWRWFWVKVSVGLTNSTLALLNAFAKLGRDASNGQSHSTILLFHFIIR